MGERHLEKHTNVVSRNTTETTTTSKMAIIITICTTDEVTLALKPHFVLISFFSWKKVVRNYRRQRFFI